MRHHLKDLMVLLMLGNFTLLNAAEPKASYHHFFSCTFFAILFLLKKVVK